MKATTERKAWTVERMTAFLRRAGVDPETGKRAGVEEHVVALSETAEEYHAGRISYEEFDRRNREAWAAIEAGEVRR